MEVKFLPVPLLRSNRIFSAEALLKAAQHKHSRHYKQFDQHLDYVLLYPDQTIVQTLPGSSIVSPLTNIKKNFLQVARLVVQDLGHPKLYFLEGESESSEPGPSYLSDTVTTAYSEAKERDGSSKISSCQVKTSPSTNGAITKTSYPPRGTSPCPTYFKVFPLEDYS